MLMLINKALCNLCANRVYESGQDRRVHARIGPGFPGIPGEVAKPVLAVQLAQHKKGERV